MPRAASAVPPRPSTRRTLMRGTMLAATLGLLATTAQAQPLPGGGKVVAGTAGISTSGSTTLITQSSDKAIIDWQSFSIGKGATVQFDNGSGATLNRVTGANLSSIDGLLSATGSVYLINPNGVIIGKTGVVRTGGGFVASTLDIGNANFLNGGDQTLAGTSLASVVNLGKIGALGGDVALVAANVRNDGTVVAPNGTLGLLAGSRVLMRDTAVNDGKFLVLSGGGTSVTNTGTVEAASAELRAEGGNIYALAGNTTGVIRADGVRSTDGHIYLTAGVNGSVDVSGSTLKAADSAGNGGAITITGGQIAVAPDATLDASATAATGNGGTVGVIADMTAGSLAFQGRALARGGVNGGNGGQVETSGHSVDFDGARIDTSAAGKSGTWLVDPYDLTVDSAAASTIDGNLATTDVTLQTTASGTSGSGNANASGNGDIIISSALSWSSSHILTLDAYHSIGIDANVTVSGAGGVVLKTNDGGSGGDYTFALGNALSFTGTSGSLTVNSHAYTLLTSMAGVAGMNNASNTTYYALAASLTPSSSYSAAVVNAFSGTFTGLGHTINNLTITGSNAHASLIGSNSGTVRDIGLAGGSISGGGYTGALVGANYSGSVVRNAYATATVTGTASSSYVGGLVGYNVGTITNSFDTGTVSAGSSSTWVGGLAGYSNGTISNTYATGNVKGYSYTGGLVGQNQSSGTISTSYATGTVTNTSGSHVGGLVGGSLNPGTLLVNAYYDTTTSGQGGYGTSQTTSQLQGTLPSGFSATAWGTGTGLYPYLKSFYPGGVVAVSGIADTSSNTAAVNATIGLYSGGSLQGSAISGANGYYYIPVAAGTAGSAAGVTETLSGSGSVSGAGYSDTATLSSSSITGLNVASGAFDYYTASSSYAAVKAGAASAFGSTYYGTLRTATLPSAAYNIYASGDFTLDSTFDATSAILIKTLGGSLYVGSDLALSGATGLTLDAYNDIHIDGNLTASGTNAIALKTGDGGSGDYSFLTGKSLSFTDAPGAGQSLTINGQTYSLLYTIGNLTAVNGGSGHYALAASLDLSGTTYTGSVLASMNGTLTGLGHTLSNLNINAASTDDVGLVGFNFGTVRDIGLAGGTIYGHYYSGSLVGENDGTVQDAYSSVNMNVAWRSGGLVGVNQGLVTLSHATGAVTSSGDNGGGVSDMGGLVGWNEGGTVSLSYATGTVTAISNTAGGLVAYNNGGTIINSFATGGVFGNNYAGGLVGFGDSGGTITGSFSTGYVSATSNGGGLVGHFIGTIDNSYWDTTTSGTSAGAGDGAGSSISGTGAAGLSRTTLQSGSLPTGFSNSVWATGSGLYPYLTALFPTGMQSISGYTYAGPGSTAPAATLAVYIGGTQVGGTTAASGADGYYYLMATPGTVSSNTQVGVSETLHGDSSVSGIAYTDVPSLTSGQVTGFDVQSGRVTITTGATTYSAVQTDLSNTFGSAYSAIQTGTAAADTYITGSNSFSFDQAGSFGGGLSVTAPSGITLAHNLTTSGATSFNSAVTLAGDSTISAGSGAVGFAATVDGAHNLTVDTSGMTTFAGTVGGGTALSSLTTDAGGTTRLGGTVTTIGLQTFNDPVTLTANTSLAAGGALTLGSTVNGGYSLTLSGSSLSFGGAVGGSTAPTSVSGTATDGNISVGGQISTTGAIFLAANGNFVNTAGAAALNPGTNFTVYTQNASDPTGTLPTDTSGGLTATNYYNDAYDFTHATFAGAAPTGNYFVYGYAASLTPTLSGSASKTYDATTTAGTSGLTLGGSLLSAGDSVSLAFTSAAFDTQNAGSGKTVTASGVTLTSNPNNYLLASTSASAAVGTISPAALTLAAVTDIKTYDATTTSTGTVGITGLQGSDTVTGLSQSFGSKNVLGIGGSTLAVDSGYTVNDGNGGNNYTVTTQAASGTINPAALTLAAVTDIKTYDATTTSSGTIGITGLQGSDTVTDLSQSFGSKNVLGIGGSTLAVNSGYTVNDGNGGGNYTITTQTASGTINKAALTLAATTDAKTYDATTGSAGAVTVSGLQGGDTVNGATESFDSKNAGSRTLLVDTGYTVNDGNGGGNYTITTQAASGTINKAALTLAATTDAKTYDATTGSTGAVTVSGLQGGDTVSGTSQAFGSRNAGAQTLSVAGYVINDGNGGGNYTITTQTASGTINKAALTLAATTDAKTYDATTGSTGAVTVSGLQGGDTVNGATESFDSKNAGSRTLLVDTGYTVNDGSGGGNYTVTTRTASGTINKAALTLAATTDTKTYDATTGSTGTVGVSGLQGSDTVTGTSQAFASKNAGAQTIDVTGYTVNDGNGGGNYTVTTRAASGTIDKAALIASLTGTTSKTYDATVAATLAAGNYVLTGLKGSDSLALNDPVSGAYADANAATGKRVFVSGLALTGTDAGNYTVNGAASADIGRITPAALTIAADNLGKNAGATDPALTYAITSGRLDGSDSLSGSLTRDTGENPGIYAITQGSLAASSNYDVTFIPGAFTITAVALQNDPVVNPIGNSNSGAGQPTIQPSPIVMSGGSSTPTASDASSTTSSDGGSGAKDAGSSAGGGDEKSTGPNIQTAGMSNSTCTDGCSNTPYPTNQYISSSISFSQ